MDLPLTSVWECPCEPLSVKLWTSFKRWKELEGGAECNGRTWRHRAASGDVPQMTSSFLHLSSNYGAGQMAVPCMGPKACVQM